MIWQELLARGSRTTGLELVPSSDQALPLAAHIIAQRVGYAHHGIYIGNGKVMHYAGLSRALRREPVMEVSLAQFSRGRPIRVLRHSPRPFTTDEVIARARSRLGENRYRILSNNCEHFCEWCIGGENRSRQIEVWRMRVRAVCRIFELRRHALTRSPGLVRDERDAADGAQAAQA